MRTRVGDAALAALGWALYPFVWLAVAIDRRPRPQCPECVLALNHPGRHVPPL